MIEQKKKICVECNRSCFWFSRKRCRFCTMKESQLTQNKKKRNYAKKVKRKKAPEKTEKQKLIDYLDRDFSLLVRALAASEGRVKCYTCGKEMAWKGSDGAQAGHFRGRGSMGTRWDLNNGKPQCHHCNVTLSGNVEVFESRLREEFGNELIDALILKSNTITIYNVGELKRLHKEIKKQLKAVLKKKHLK